MYNIWVEIVCLGNMHFMCHFLSVFMVTLSQNEPSEARTKSAQLTITLRRVTAVFAKRGHHLCLTFRWLILSPGHHEKLQKVTHKVHISNP